jgi:hypothetical protein
MDGIGMTACPVAVFGICSVEPFQFIIDYNLTCHYTVLIIDSVLK